MWLKDDLYGEYKVDSVLEELILSDPVQRLKGIHQGGASFLVNEKWDVTRYEHSVGVMLLIKKLGGSVEEQIAGLLHDVSHTAFSHVIDGVLDNLSEDYHEDIFEQVIHDSGIPQILEKYDYDYRDIILDDSRWSLLEQPAPELCADRVDYTLRDMYRYGYISLKEVHDFLDEVAVAEGKICVKTIEASEWFVKTYYTEVIDFFMNPLNIYGNHSLSNVLKAALEKGWISLDDFLGEDEEVLLKLQKTDDKIQMLLSELNQDVYIEENKANYDIHHKGKVRLIDPSVVNRNGLLKSSVLSEEVRQRGEAAYEISKTGRYMKVIRPGGPSLVE
ncbi:HD domain-containing protein [Rossellomorea aquimaris]|nr:HD domain-containing protein [Rossellomorea aquimaris]WRP07217.1 HD domain-containing protein [Rossellomorea aquimaris]